jgi:hypothetical protein
LQSCVSCNISTSIIDPSQIDGLGNYVQCKCSNGYYARENTCYNVDATGNCNSFNCVSCLTNGMVSYSDRSGCVFCGNTTLGISPSTNECQCNLNEALVESDQFGNLYQNKSCHVCPSGQSVILANTQIAGKNYFTNYYVCQSCPDELMTMSVTTSGNSFLYACTCQTGCHILLSHTHLLF